MTQPHQQGQASLTAIVFLVGLIVTGVWVWKRLSLEAQDYIIDQALPFAALALVTGVLLFTAIQKVRRRIRRRQERDRLITAFQREIAQDKRLELSFALTEINGYRLKGLESIEPALKELWVSTLRRALGEKQYLIRGRAASHLGVLQDKAVVPLLVKALEDDHAYVRSCAALGLGRLRATEARERLLILMEEDWDQTVRSRAKEAVERLGA
jgi:HEAT repeat protein